MLHRSFRRSLALLVAVVVVSLAPGEASATHTGALTLTSTATPSFSVTLNGFNQLVNYTVPATLSETRHNGNGWRMTLTSTTFRTITGTIRSLPASASSVTGVTWSCVTGFTCVNPTNSVTYPVSVPAGTTPPTPVRIVNAANRTGSGQFTITPTVRVTVPANSYAGTYRSTLSVAVLAGP